MTLMEKFCSTCGYKFVTLSEEPCEKCWSYDTRPFWKPKEEVMIKLEKLPVVNY